jgi:hypothetical protein
VINRVVNRQVQATKEVPTSELRRATSQLYGGRITLEQWQTVVAYELKDAHLAQAMLAVGGKNNLSPATLSRLRDTLRKEYGFLNQFAIDIKSGSVSEAQALARVNQYAKASQQSYYREYAMLRTGRFVNWDVNPGENCSGCLDMQSQNPHDAATMTKFPGSGDTPCRGNCNCTLSEA